MHKKNILLVIPSLDSGGAEHQTIKIANYLKNEYNIFILSISSNIELIKDLNINKNNLFILDSNLKSFSFRKILSIEFIKTIFEIKTIMNKNNFDIVVANLPISHFIMRLVKSLVATKFKLINVHHSLQFQAHTPNLFVTLFMKYNSYLANRKDNINIFISKASREDQLSFLKVPLSKTKVIYNGVSIKESNAHFNNLFTDLDEFNIVMAARFVTEKNHQLLIESILELLEQNSISNVSLYFLGDGRLKDKMMDIVNNTPHKKIFKFKGTVEHNKVLSYFKNSDLVVIPSQSEGFGNIAVEAGLMGARILSSDVGGLKEIIEENVNGFVFKSEDIIDLKQQLLEIINDNKDVDRDKVKEMMDKRFSFENMIEGYIRVIENI